MHYTLAEEDDQRPSAHYLGWRRWLTQQGVADLQPRRWLYLNFTYQQIQAALSGQALALARLALVADSLQRGELIEPFGLGGRSSSPSAYWLLRSPAHAHKPEVSLFCNWLLDQARLTRLALGETAQDIDDGLGD